MSKYVVSEEAKRQWERDYRIHETCQQANARIAKQREIAVVLLAGDPSQIGHYNQRTHQIVIDEGFAMAKVKAAFDFADMILDREEQLRYNAKQDAIELEDAVELRDEQNANPGSVTVERHEGE